MTTLSHRVKTNRDKVYVDNPALVSNEFNESKIHPTNYKVIHPASPKKSTKFQKSAYETLKQQEADQIMNIKIKKSVEVNRENELNKFLKTLDNVNKAMQFANEIDSQLHIHDESEHNKMKRRYDEWNVNVHGEIQVNHFFFIL